jgi:hypothetical protein
MTPGITAPLFCDYNEYEASVGGDGELLTGSLPAKQRKPVQAQAAICEKERYIAWNKAVRDIPADADIV